MSANSIPLLFTRSLCLEKQHTFIKSVIILILYFYPDILLFLGVWCHPPLRFTFLTLGSTSLFSFPSLTPCHSSLLLSSTLFHTCSSLCPRLIHPRLPAFVFCSPLSASSSHLEFSPFSWILSLTVGLFFINTVPLTVPSVFFLTFLFLHLISDSSIFSYLRRQNLSMKSTNVLRIHSNVEVTTCSHYSKLHELTKRYHFLLWCVKPDAYFWQILFLFTSSCVFLTLQVMTVQWWRGYLIMQQQ